MDPAGPFAHHLRVPACQPWPAKLNPHLPPATEVAIVSHASDSASELTLSFLEVPACWDRGGKKTNTCSNE